jgi:hypothetical protein
MKFVADSSSLCIFAVELRCDRKDIYLLNVVLLECLEMSKILVNNNTPFRTSIAD